MSEFQSQNKFQLMYSYKASHKGWQNSSLVLLLGNALDLRVSSFRRSNDIGGSG